MTSTTRGTADRACTDMTPWRRLRTVIANVPAQPGRTGTAGRWSRRRCSGRLSARWLRVPQEAPAAGAGRLGGRLRDAGGVQPTVDLGAHDVAVGRRVVEPAPQRAGQEPAGVL